MKLALVLAGFATLSLVAADAPQWGQAWTRNMVSEEIGLPATFDPDTGKNVKWIVPLGNETHSTPVIADGRIFIGTNNARPRDPRITDDRGVLLCLDEKDGSFLWQLAVPKRIEDKYFDWPNTGMSSSPTVEGDRVYIVDNRHTVLCLDVRGMANGNDGDFQDEGAYGTPHQAGPPEFTPAITPRADAAFQPGDKDADILWAFDMPAQAGIWPHDGAFSSILVHGDYLYINTSTGVDNSHQVIRTPKAPSLIVLDKKTGELVARDEENIAPNIFHATWSSPSLATIDGVEQIIFGGGDGVVRGFQPVRARKLRGEVATLKLLWRIDFDPEAPKDDIHRFLNNKRQGPSNIYGMPVVSGDRLFVAGGGDVFWGKNEAWMKCYRLGGEGDLTSRAWQWSYPLDRHTLSTPAVHDGLVYIADAGRKIHCVDAATGQGLWVQDTKGDFWSSPLVADGKVYLGSRKGDFWILKAGREKEVLAEVDLERPISATAVAANGVIYIATMDRLLAIAADADSTR
ncbi:MAG: PQQ-binding-like beta-propeller repeat protein [Chthoniobacteraceae bacterium]